MTTWTKKERGLLDSARREALRALDLLRLDRAYLARDLMASDGPELIRQALVARAARYRATATGLFGQARFCRSLTFAADELREPIALSCDKKAVRMTWYARSDEDLARKVEEHGLPEDL